MKKFLSVMMLVACSVLALTACEFPGLGGNETGKVYYLNFKPEQDQQWKDLAAKYTEETGVEVTVVTAASGTYESTLTAELDKEVKRIVDERYSLAKQLLTDNRDLLEAIAKELLEKETLDDEDVTQIIARVKGDDFVDKL